MRSTKLFLALALTCVAANARATQQPPACEPNPQAKANPKSSDVSEGTWVNGVRTPTTVSLNGAGSKGDGYAWSQVSTGPQGSFVRRPNDRDDQVDFVTPDVPAGGATIVIRLTVTGCNGKTATDDAIVNVSDVLHNRAPTAVVAASPATVYEQQQFTLSGAGSSDPDGDPLTYSWEQLVGAAWVPVSSASSVALVAPNVSDPNGVTLTFRLTVSDGKLTATATQLVNVVWVNEPPVASAACTPEVREGGYVLLDASGATDVDDGIRSYLWRQLEGGPTATLTSQMLALKAFEFDAPVLTHGKTDTMKFSVTVTDVGGLSTAAECSVRVLDVTPPVLTIAGASAEATSTAGAAVPFVVTATDRFDGDEDPSFVHCVPAPGSTFPFGETAVSCDGRDQAGNSASASFTVKVTDMTPPNLEVPSDMIVEATGPSGAVVEFVASASDLLDGAVTPVCTPASGATFALGTTTVSCVATDARGNDSDAKFKVTVQDTTAPTLPAPADLTVEATGPQTTVTWPAVKATDLVDGTFNATCTPASGTTFPVGATTVTCAASDKAGNAAEAKSFTVTVKDSTPPVITVPADLTAEATGPAGAAVEFEASATDLVDGAVAVACTPASGATLALGTTTVSCAATDAHGNHDTKSFKVTVQDTTPPALTVPANMTAEATGPDGAGVTFGASATDLVDGAVVPVCTPASGATFPLGTTTVSCSATDAHQNKATGSFTVTVKDTTPPVLTVPANMTAEATGADGAAVTFVASAVDLVDGAVVPVCTPASGATFPLGTTTVSCSATDAHQNKATGSFTVTVKDTTPPALKLPANVTAEATGSDGAAVSFEASATDLVDGKVAVSCSPASGATFALGAHTVSCSAKDAAGNEATGAFTVTVRDTTPPTIGDATDVTIEATGPQTTVTWPAVKATDLVDGTFNATCTPASGTTFPVGATTVTCAASDKAGNAAEAKSFTVTVKDSTPPTIGVASNVTIEATGPQTTVTWPAVKATDLVDGTFDATCTPASGATFPVGATTVTCRATDHAGNPATAKTFTVTVSDTTPPTIADAANVTIEATGPQTIVTWPAPKATDLVDGTFDASCAPASGTTFPLGTAQVTCTATDHAGNHAVAKTFTVTVKDTTSPTIADPANVTIEATGPQTIVTWPAPKATDLVDGTFDATCTPASGASFPVGATQVTCTASDKQGNVGAAKGFLVTVTDTTPPVVKVPANITTGPAGWNGATVSYAASATDLVDGAVQTKCSPASGTLFAPGTTTTVTCSATDAHGNTGFATFQVTIRPFTFLGFFQPVDNLPVVNTVKNGSTVPVKWKLRGEGGSEITDVKSVASMSAVQLNCNSLATLESVIEATATGGTVLRYDATGMQFVFNWQTPKAAGTCWRLDVVFTDGTTQSADFKLK